MNSSNTFTVARKKRLDHDKERFELRATSAMQWMAAMLQHDTAIATTYAKVVLAPVFRLVNSERREVSNDLRSLGQELMEMLQTAMDSGGAEDGTFLTLHEEVRTRVMDTKLDRKRKRAQQKLMIPKQQLCTKCIEKMPRKGTGIRRKCRMGIIKREEEEEAMKIFCNSFIFDEKEVLLYTRARTYNTIHVIRKEIGFSVFP